MTTEQTFKCNLCRDTITPSAFATKNGFGVHFVAGGSSVFKRPSECEHHICHQCAQSIHDELRKITQAIEQEEEK